MSSFRVNKHEIRVFINQEAIFEEIVLWGEACWWPKFSNMRFIKQSQEKVQEGTKYTMKIVPFGPAWEAQVTKLEDNYSIRRDFLSGFLSGFETVSILPAEKIGYKVAYEMFYKIESSGLKLLWNSILVHIHNHNIRSILKNLKRHLERIK